MGYRLRQEMTGAIGVSGIPVTAHDLSHFEPFFSGPMTQGFMKRWAIWEVDRQ